jgi:cryptochrome
MFLGGETEALRRLNEMVNQRPNWVVNFAKPNTSPNSLEPSTTVNEENHNLMYFDINFFV